jgi:putative transposase
MILAHEIALDPTEKQKIALSKAVGCARFAYNWGLAEWKRQYELGLKPNANKIKKAFNAIKKTEFPWIYESPKDANQEAFSDLGSAFGNFFKSLKGERSGPKIHYPNFKKKGKSKDAFSVSNDKFHFESDKRVRLPVIGSVKIRESLRLQGKILGGRVKRVADKWFLSVQVEGNFKREPAFIHLIAGIDLGIRTAVVSSQQGKLISPNPLKAALIKLKKANRKLHRRKKGSANRHKAKIQVARIHRRVANIRKDFMHKVTTQLVRENQTNVIEDLNVSSMLKNHKLARAISDVGFGLFRQFMAYKSLLFGGELIVADRWFASSKTCSDCLEKNEDLTLSDREWVCERCSVVHDRDENAAKMLEMYPRLLGEQGIQSRTPMDDYTSTPRVKDRRASKIAEVGTKPCSHLSTN